MDDDMSDPLRYTSPYVFQEFPKWVRLADGQEILCNTPEEENAAIALQFEDQGTEEETSEDGVVSLKRRTRKAG